MPLRLEELKVGPDAAGALDFHLDRLRAPLLIVGFDVTRHGDRALEKQQLSIQRGLTRVGLRNDHKDVRVRPRLCAELGRSTCDWASLLRMRY